MTPTETKAALVSVQEALENIVLSYHVYSKLEIFRIVEQALELLPSLIEGVRPCSRCQENGWRPISEAPVNKIMDIWGQERERYEPGRIPNCIYLNGKWHRSPDIYDGLDNDNPIPVINPTRFMEPPTPPKED